MRPKSFPSSLPLAAGLAIALSSQVVADPAVSATPTRAGKLTDLRVEREAVDLSSLRDNGFGAVRPGQKPQLEGARPSLDAVHVGADTAYTFRTVGGRVELWAQELRLGKLAWTWWDAL